MLGRIRAALASAPETVSVERSHRRASDEGAAAIQAEFIDKVRDYRAQVRTDLAETELAAATAAICREHGVRRLVAPDDLPARWLPEEPEKSRLCATIRHSPTRRSISAVVF